MFCPHAALDGPGYLDEPPGLVTDDELDDEDQDWGANFDGAPMMDINLNMEQVPGGAEVGTQTTP